MHTETLKNAESGLEKGNEIMPNYAVK